MPARRPKARHTHRGTHTHRPASARIAIHPPRARCVGQSLAWQWCTRVIHTCVAGLKPRRRRAYAAMARAHPSRKGGDVQRAVAVARPVAGPEGGAVTHRARLRALRRGLAARGARRRRPRRSALRRGGARWLRGARARRAWRAPGARGAPRGGLRAGPSPPERGVQAARRRGGVTATNSEESESVAPRISPPVAAYKKARKTNDERPLLPPIAPRETGRSAHASRHTCT